MDTVLAQLGRGILHAFLECVTFPAWWYTAGLVRVLRWAGGTIRGWERVVGLRLWARNLFVPMYGQADWQGRIISVVMRFVVLIGRTIQIGIGVLAVFCAAAIYLVLPITAVAMLVAAVFAA